MSSIREHSFFHSGANKQIYKSIVIKIAWSYHGSREWGYGKLLLYEGSIIVFIKVMDIFAFVFIFISACNGYNIIISIIVYIQNSKIRFRIFLLSCQSF